MLFNKHFNFTQFSTIKTYIAYDLDCNQCDARLIFRFQYMHVCWGMIIDIDFEAIPIDSQDRWQ